MSKITGRMPRIVPAGKTYLAGEPTHRNPPRRANP
ncbi:MAG: hypothetical protein JWQ20_3325 [Conexibacter sp.]|nr:hypothetical protein [Conexibacter sp.]